MISVNPVSISRIIIIFLVAESLMRLDRRIPIARPINTNGSSTKACFNMGIVSIPIVEYSIILKVFSTKNTIQRLARNSLLF